MQLKLSCRVGIDVDGKEKAHIRFPGFGTYVPPEKDEEHNDDPLTESEIKQLEKQEEKFQKAKKKRKRQQRAQSLRDRAKKRAKDMKLKKPKV